MGKHRNRPAKGGPKRISSSGLRDEESSLGALHRAPTASLSGRDRSRIAVLSFAASGAEQSEHLALSLGQEITAALGRSCRLDVIAGMSDSGAARCEVREHQFCRMDLDYLVDVTVAQNGQGSQVNVRLLDFSGNARSLWSKSFEPTNYTVSQIADLAASQIASHIDPTLPPLENELKLRNRHGTTGLLRRVMPLMSSVERDKFRQAGQLIKFALEVEPDDEEIATWAARWQHFNIQLGYGQHSRQEFAKVPGFALRAIRSNPDNAEALGMYAHYCAFLEKDFDTALHHFDRSLRINPSLAFIWGLSSLTYCYIGEPRTALKCLDRYRELAPFDPYMSSVFEVPSTIAYLFSQDYERAAIVGRRAVDGVPEFVNVYKPLIAALGHLGRRDEAKPYLDKLLTLEPGFTVETFAEVYPIKKAADRRRYMEGLRLGGVAAR